MKLMRLLQRLKSREGISLVEVLVAIAIFVGGILAVMRMFPGGFMAVKHSQNVTLADRLAQAELERWRNRPANLPSGILPWGYDPNTGTYTVLADTDPEDLRDPTEPPGHWPDGFNMYYYTDVNKFRRVHGEVTKIPVPLSMDWGYGCVYVLGFSPILVDPAQNSTLTVYGGPMKRLTLPRSLADLEISSSREYVIDYDDSDGDREAAVIYVSPAAYLRNYVLTYSYWVDAPPRLVSVVSQAIEIAIATQAEIDQGYQGVYIPDPEPPGGLLKDNTSFIGVDRGSDSLHRAFSELALGAAWGPNNPYQYQVASPTVGVLLFNPAGYGYEELTARGKEPLTAYIDYTVLDWHIISDERKVADVIQHPADGAVKLSLRFLKEAGVTVEHNGDTYAGLAPSYNLPNSILAVDMETGEVYDETSTVPAGLPTAGAPVMAVDYKEGIVTFNVAYAAHTFRIYYRAEGDWALQTFKAYDVYGRSYGAPSSTSPGYGQYYYDSAALNSGGDYRVYFRLCHAGSTVAVDYKYVASEPGGSMVEHTVYGDLCQVSMDTGNLGLCYIDLLPKIERLYPAGTALAVKEVSKVRGVSVGARVIWRESGTGLRAGKWRHKELQTCLVRAGS